MGSQSPTLRTGGGSSGVFTRVAFEKLRDTLKQEPTEGPFGYTYSETKYKGPPIKVESRPLSINVTGYGSDLYGEMNFSSYNGADIFRCPHEGLVVDLINSSRNVGKRDLRFKLSIGVATIDRNDRHMGLGISWEDASEQFFGDSIPKPIHPFTPDSEWTRPNYNMRPAFMYVFREFSIGDQHDDAQNGAIGVELTHYDPTDTRYADHPEHVSVAFCVKSRAPNIIRQGMRWIYHRLMPVYSTTVQQWAGSELAKFCGDFMPWAESTGYAVSGNTGEEELFEFEERSDGFSLLFPRGLPDWLRVDSTKAPETSGECIRLKRNRESQEFQSLDESQGVEFAGKLKDRNFVVKRANLPKRQGSLLVCTWK